jgi:hypothetical protein
MDRALARSIIAALAIVAGLCSNAVAQPSGGTMQKTANGLTITYHYPWNMGAGYRPVGVTITPTTPLAADRTLSFELSLQGFRGRNVLVKRDVDLPAGTGPTGPVETTLSAPDSWPSYGQFISVTEDGAAQRGLSDNRNANWNGTARECPTVLFAGANVPDVSGLAGAFPDYVLRNASSGRFMTSSISPVFPTAAACPITEWPEQWIDYTGLDIVCLSLEELGQLRANRPLAFRALLDWTAVGGNLWVYGIGSQWERLPKLEELLLPPEQANAASAPQARRWAPAHNEIQSDLISRGAIPLCPALLPAPSVERSDTSASPGPAGGPVDDAAASPTAGGRRPPPCTACPLGMGTVVALAADNPFPGASQDWKWILDTMGSDRWSWSRRHGISYTADNPDFWNFLIPGVGLPPVGVFCLLITLFVAAIGPANYWLLRRWKRLHLLVVTVPAGALAVTAVLLGYALATDGLGVRVRARSVTVLDQRQGRAACWARLSYYAGLSPRGGLTFPADVAVLPLEPLAGDIPARQTRNLTWDDQGQNLAVGWLPARTPTQYLTLRSRATNFGLDFLPAEEVSGRPSVRNRLGTPIRQLLVRADDGQYYWAEDVDSEATVPLTVVTLDDAVSRLQKAWRAAEPQLPPGFEPPTGGAFSGRRRYWWTSSRGEDPHCAASRLEELLDWPQGLGKSDSGPLAPGSYVAVVDRSPEVVLGLAAREAEGGYHVVFGQW